MLRSGGQAVLEYVLLFAVVAAAILGMQVLGKRGIQGVLKAAADDLTTVLPDLPPEHPFATLPKEVRAQLEGLRYESGADTRNRRGELVVVQGKVLTRDSKVTTTDDSTIRMGATAGGGVSTENVDVSSVTEGTSSARVVAEVKN